VGIDENGQMDVHSGP